MAELIRPPAGPSYADLRGKTALVTGGGSGIGLGISLRLAAEGMTVCLCGRTLSTLERTAAAIRDRGGNAVPIRGDVSCPDAVAEIVAAIADQAGPLDLLVHNAAWVHGDTLADTAYDDWRRMLATNLDSAALLSRAAMDVMVPRRSGALVFITSIGAQRAHHGMTAYDVSKGGLDALTRSLALELAPHGVRVNAVAPGATHRDAHGASVAAEELRQPYVPMGRSGTPAEIAAAVAFLASVQASYITGQILTVDGGATAQLSPRGFRI